MMDWALLGKIALAAPGLAGLILIVRMMLQNRRTMQQNGFADRADERDAIVRLAENHIEHSAEAMEGIARAVGSLEAAQRDVAASNREMAGAFRTMQGKCPLMNGPTSPED